ncbi:PqqD family protein [Bacteroides sp. 51]|uniref:PqqD family protein n=1 Tax=Bacteroides sp. 51 TaxID=2302938 RepID=UPI0013D03E49|nr:PqqD family protein [Bacteroides sp. 51]NDV81117.1 PqqD family protein [Bacteroides sp. 51]
MKNTKINLLDVIPSRAEHILTENEGELSVIAFPRFKRAWIRKYFLPKNMSPYIRVRLEEHGSAVWNLIDGKRTVREIIQLLSDYFGNEENYEQRVTIYITQLRKDGFIRYSIPTILP